VARSGQRPPREKWPDVPRQRDVVLHTRVVTETGGGPDKTIFLSAPFLSHTNYWLAAAYMHPRDDPGFTQVRQRAATVGCPLISVPDTGPLDRSVLRQLFHICRKYRVKIWHGHDYKSNMFGLALLPFWSMKLVSTVHGWVKHTSRTPLYYAMDRWCLPKYDHVICVSEDLMEMARAQGVRDDRLTLIHNAIDERTFQRRHPPAQSPLRAQMDTPPQRLVIGAVGRLSPEKAFNHLIRSIHQLLSEGHDLELWIVGEGDARGDLESLIAQLGVGERVKLLGFHADMVGLYHALDLFVLSSLREGLPNVVLEAMAMTVPVVSTRVAGVPMLIEDQVHGLLCAVGDVPALTAAVRTLVSDPTLRTRLTEAARARIEREYSFTRRMAKVKRVYDHVLGVSEVSGLAQASAPVHLPNQA
jgi:glycosyltransferase involved in cell wall biosynthesis